MTLGQGQGYRKTARPLAAISMLLLLAGPAGIASAGEPPIPTRRPGESRLTPIYHLALTIRSCQAEILLNGFPLISLSAQNEQPVSFSPPVNPYLAGKRNTVEIELRPAVRPDGTELPFADAYFTMEVQEYKEGDIVEPGGGGSVTKFSMPASVREQIRKGKKKPPLKFTHTFANASGIDFSAELLDAPPFTDKKAVADYAMHLRDLMAKGDVDGLIAEYEYKVRVGAEAYGNPYQERWANTRKGLAEFVGRKPGLDFGPADLDLRPRCGGRMWELSRKGGKEFLRTADDRGRLIVFVGLRNGKIRVVR
jgi:hypothetical protein